MQCATSSTEFIFTNISNLFLSITRHTARKSVHFLLSVYMVLLSFPNNKNDALKTVAMAMRVNEFIKLLTEHKNGIECFVSMSVCV